MEVEGIILILSCEKHKNTRLVEYGPIQDEYEGWKVVRVIGDLFLDKDYEFRNEKLLMNNGYELEKEILYVKCEDSYLHLLKKLALSMKYLKETYKIKQGILRCGDDLVFNDDLLVKFLRGKKYDFYGKSYEKKDCAIKNIEILKNRRYDPMMWHYYAQHQEELVASNHGVNLTLDGLRKYLLRPHVSGPAGIIYYLSTRACDIVVDTMEKVGYNIFHFDEFTQSYPYTIEDCAVTFIMYYNKVTFTDNQIFFADKDAKNPREFIVRHTNAYK